MNFGKHNVSNRNKFGKESELLMKKGGNSEWTVELEKIEICP